VQEGFWSPDGKWLIVRVNGANSNDILGFRPGTDSVPTPLVASDQFDEMSPALSPDGRWLAYVSNESGSLQVYVRPFPNTNETRWVVSLGYGQEPVWSPRGNELFYKGGSGVLVAAQLSTVPTFSVTARTQLFDIGPFDGNQGHPRYQVTKDGQRFLMSAIPQTQGRAELVFVLNWLEELKARKAN
jgi:serine/threonine-protein kinase